MDDCLDNCADVFGRMSAGKRCGLISGCLAFISFIVLITVSVEGVEPTEWALVQDNITQDVDRDDILQGGLHWIGLFRRLIVFPSTYKTIMFGDDKEDQMPALQTRTIEGLDLKVHFALQYQLIPDELPEMYKQLASGYEKIFARVAKNSVLNTACQYKATDYWSQRAQIGDKMLQDLQWNLKPLHTKVVGFMLLRIELPNEFENAIIDTEVTIQERLTEGVMQSVHVGEQVIDNIKAAAGRDISNTNSKAEADATILENQCKGDVAKQNIDGHTKGLYYVLQELNFRGQNKKGDILEYFKYQRMASLSENTPYKLVVGKGLEASVMR